MKRDYKTSLDTYNKTAQSLCAVYNALNSADVLPGLEERLPKAMPGKARKLALDLGCGSGRDAFWLAQKGFQVVAVDGAAEMIRLARENFPHKNIEYRVDLMPALDRGTLAGGRRFDLVLMSASWMHLDPADREKLIDILTPRLKPDGLVYISLRHGPAPSDRPMFPVSAAELSAFAARKNLHFEKLQGLDDKQGRGAVSWDYVTLRAPK